MNKQEKFKELLSSALSGNKEVYNLLGFAYETGYGISKNYTEAIKWYFKAIECGIYDSSIINLALIYQNEEIVGKPNYKLSYALLNDAIKHNITQAYFFLGDLYMYGLGSQIDYDKAMECFKRVNKNDRGYMYAQFKIGNIYECEDKKLKDIQKAMEYYEKVKIPTAKNRLAFLYLLQNYESDIDIIREKYLQSYESGNACEEYVLNILEKLNGRKIKAIDNIGELKDFDIDELSNEYGAIFIKTTNAVKDVNTLYSIEDIKSLKERITGFLNDIDDLNEEKSNELDVFMQIYVKIGKNINYDFKSEKNALASSNLYTARNLTNALLYNRCVCGGFVELLRNALEIKGIKTRLVSSASHVFLQVKIGENWYYTDPTTDGQFIKKDKNMLYCLLSEEDMTNMHINHDKFIKGNEKYPSEFSYPKEELIKKYNKCLDKYKTLEFE